MIYMENQLIGSRLRSVRKEHGLGCREVAAALGITEGHYRKIERGIYGLDLRKAYILERYMGVNVRYLMHGDEKERGIIYYPIEMTDKNNAYVCQLLEYCKEQLEAGEELEWEEKKAEENKQ